MYVIAGIKNFLKRFLPMPARWAHDQNQYLNEKIKLIEENSSVDRAKLAAIIERIDRLSESLQSHEENMKKQTEQAVKNLAIDFVSHLHMLENKIEINTKTQSGQIAKQMSDELNSKSQSIITNIENYFVKLSGEIEGKSEKLFIEIAGQSGKFSNEIKNQSDKLSNELKSIDKHNKENSNKILSDMRPIADNIKKSGNELTKIHSTASEILWANIFNNTVSDSLWLHDKTLSPGRWAAGYPFLYILYRVLRDAKPKRILELGLGETTKLISQYAAANGDIEHFVAEHDPEWISFFSQAFALPDNTKIEQLPWGYEPYKEAESVRVYDGFPERFKNGKYDFICIDGPFGGDMKDYARIDVLNLMLENLGESFVILLDDYNRSGEQKTAVEILGKLDGGNVSYAKSTYNGQKAGLIVCSEDMKFLISL